LTDEGRAHLEELRATSDAQTDEDADSARDDSGEQEGE
jgi:hypothetical protein